MEPEEFNGLSRREFVGRVALGGTLLAVGLEAAPSSTAEPTSVTEITTTVNGVPRTLKLDPRMTLLDVLREKLGLMGTKKGCDHGQCGACTVLVNGKRINSCLKLGVMCQGAEITTVEGLATGPELHPMQASFIKHDAFQCGYCTPGQICSAVALVHEGHAKTDAEIRELMSGNICRCGAYRNILAAIREVQHATGT